MKSEKFSVGPSVAVQIMGHNAAGTGAGAGSVSYPTAGLIRFPTGNPTVYLGGVDVNTTSGTPFVAGENVQTDLVNEILYAITVSTTATVYVLRRGD